MVLKKSKGGQNTGNTFSTYSCIKHLHHRYGYITKMLLNRNFDIKEKDEVNAKFGEIVADGHLSPEYDFFNCYLCCYSLHKHKRWLLPAQIKEVIDSEVTKDEPYRLVLHERENFSNGFSFRIQDTVGYHDSAYTVHSSYPKQRFSSLEDLKMNLHEKTVSKQHKKSKKKGRNTRGNIRGVQRKIPPVKPVWYPWARHTEEPERYHGNIISGDYHGKDQPEIRYEVCYFSNRLDTRRPLCCKHQKGYVVGYMGERPSRPSARNKNKRATKTELRISQEEQQGLLNLSLEDDDVPMETKSSDEILLEHNTESKRIVTLADFLKCPPKKRKKRVDDLRKTSPTKGDNSAIIRTDMGDNSTGAPNIPNPVMGDNSASTPNIPNPVMGDNSVRYFRKDRKIFLISNSADDDNSTKNKEDIDVEASETEKTGQQEPQVDFSEMFTELHLATNSLEHLRSSLKYMRMNEGNCLPYRFSLPLSPDNDNEQVLFLLKETIQDSSTSSIKSWMKIQRDTTVWTDRQIKIWKDAVRELKVNLNAAKNFSISDVLFDVKNTISKTRHKSGRTLDRENENEKNHFIRKCQRSVCHVASIHEAHMMTVGEAETESTLDEQSQAEDEPSASYDIVTDVDLCEDIMDTDDNLCEICYCETQDGSVLLPCKHYFCNECWSTYVTEKVRLGRLKVTCQAYGCDSVLNEVSVMSFVSSDLFSRWTNRRKESVIESSKLWKWCPEPSCGKLAKIFNKDNYSDDNNLPVFCDCNTVWCYSCQQPAHWPASCQQAAVYRKMLQQNGHVYSAPTVEKLVFHVKVKRCPKCYYPINKNGGCNYMSCRCSHAFCWECLTSWNEHTRFGSSCIGERGETTIELTNEKAFPLPIKYYRISVEHRQKRLRDLSRPTIDKHAKTFLHSQMSREKIIMVSSRMVTDQLHYKRLHSLLTFLRQVHELMENIYIIMSHVTNKNEMVCMQNQLDPIHFCINRMELMLLDQPACKISLENLCRAEKLQACLIRMVTLLTKLLPKLQKEISASRRQILEKPLSSFKSYK